MKDWMQPLIAHMPHDARRVVYAVAKREWYSRLQHMRSADRDGYSFKQFDETRSIFVHIPKAAGVSVCLSLYGNLAGGHASIKKYQTVFSMRDFRSYFKFAFVRNPWDRLYSAYSFLRQGGMNDQDLRFAEGNLSRFRSFEDFVLNWVSHENIRRYIHFVPQTDLLRSYTGKNLAVDFIGRYENIERDFRFVRRRINPQAVLAHENKTGSRRDYREMYSENMISAVFSAYEKDIKLLGYTFDNAQP